MSDTLRDQLLGLGFSAPKPEARVERPARPNDRGNNVNAPPAAPRNDAGNRSRGDIRGRDRGRSTSREVMQPSPAPSARPAPRGRRSAGTPEEIDLGRAYALRAQREKEERIAAEAERQAAALRKREAKARVLGIVAAKSLNDPAAEIARHFDYNGKIRRVHVTQEQLRAVNAGELGVVQLDGRYCLFEASIVEAVRAELPGVIALMVDPAATAHDPYADPRFEVPDDLVW